MRFFKALLLTITLPVALLMLAVTTNPADARCFKFQRDCGASASTPTPSTRVITNPNRQRIGDLYNPGHGRRTQIRNNSQQILGYIEADGTITNPHRQRIGNIEQLLK